MRGTKFTVPPFLGIIDQGSWSSPRRSFQDHPLNQIHLPLKFMSLFSSTSIS